MKNVPIPSNELDRIKALNGYSIMDSLPEKEYDSITQLASYICKTPIALVSLLDENRQWFKSTVGLSAKETPREISFCQYAIMGDVLYEVNNALEDAKFADNPLVAGGPKIRFYAGSPLKDKEGFNLGTLCVIDTEPRVLTEDQKSALELLGQQVVSLLDLRKNNNQLLIAQKEFQNFVELSKDLVCIANVDGRFFKVNPSFTTVLGYAKEELEGQLFVDFIHPDDLDKTFKEVEKLSQGYKSISFENRYICKDGSYVLLSWNTSPDPETGNLYCIARDMTKEKIQEEKLINTTTNLTAILNASEFSIIATEIDGTIKEFNNGAENLLGYKAEEVIGQMTPAFLHLEEEIVNRAEVLTKQYGEIIEPGFGVFTYVTQKWGIADSNEWTYIRKDGTTFPVILSATAIRNSSGVITGYLGIAKDISKEKAAEQSLINSKILLDESQRIAKIGSWKFDVVSNNLVWSKGHYTIFELDEIPGDQLYEAYRKRIHPEDLPILDELSDNILENGKDFKVNYRILFPDGRIKHILEIGSPFENEIGEVVGMQGNIQDVTEIKLAEKKIEDKAKEINDVRAALDESSIVTITDQNGILTYVNDKFCNISQYSEEELLGQYHYVDASGNYSNRFVKKIWLSIANGQIWKGELQKIAKDGSYYWVDSTIVPFLNEAGEPYQYIAISSDITEKKLAEENLNNALVDLEKNNKELDQFAYVVSHDLKAPLRAINNLAEWIVEDMPDMPEDVSNNLGLLRGRILRMENLINGVLDYSRIGRTKIEMETIDLNLMLTQIVETIVPTHGFEVAIDSQMPEIFNAKILLYQVFSNIISNAVKYNDKPIGIIECSYVELASFHQFTISDNGPGIEKEYHDKVFGVFQTIEARDKKESTGIGLSIVKKIIEEKGGTIFIESEEGAGASFIFTLPK
ncbi:MULTISPECIES: PAS domain S-box protein [unclassified Flavobacterium]|uniref:PAS domain S-box protein n=1 Tax=unclassified Flavobacterium TaxID=196869 RepID=UPI003F8DBA6B